MKIEVLGTGCAKCDSLEASVKSAASKLGITYDFAKITDILEIASRGVMVTPALVIDGTVRIAGKTASEDEIADLLQTS